MKRSCHKMEVIFQDRWLDDNEKAGPRSGALRAAGTGGRATTTRLQDSDYDALPKSARKTS